MMTKQQIKRELEHDSHGVAWLSVAKGSAKGTVAAVSGR
jgi:hypothetical protein